jgi:hypothetical protein
MLDNTNWQKSLDQQLVVQALTVAHDYIERYGWAQNFGDTAELTPICPVKSLTMQNLDDRIYKLARRRIARVIGTHDIISWNDSKGRTKEQVLAVLKQAAA